MRRLKLYLWILLCWHATKHPISDDFKVDTYFVRTCLILPCDIPLFGQACSFNPQGVNSFMPFELTRP